MAFDSYWSAPNTDDMGENIVYRFGSVGQVYDELLMFTEKWIISLYYSFTLSICVVFIFT